MTIKTDIDAAIDGRPPFGRPRLRMGISAYRGLCAAWKMPEITMYRGMRIELVEKPEYEHDPRPDRFLGWEIAA